MYLEQLINTYCKINGVNQKEAAALLKISPSLLSDAKRGHKPLADHWIVDIAEGAGVAGAEALAKYHEEQAKDPKVKGIWAELAKRAAAMAPRAAGATVALMLSLQCKSLISLPFLIFW